MQNSVKYTTASVAGTNRNVTNRKSQLKKSVDKQGK